MLLIRPRYHVYVDQYGIVLICECVFSTKNKFCMIDLRDASYWTTDLKMIWETAAIAWLIWDLLSCMSAERSLHPLPGFTFSKWSEIHNCVCLLCASDSLAVYRTLKFHTVLYYIVLYVKFCKNLTCLFCMYGIMLLYLVWHMTRRDKTQSPHPGYNVSLASKIISNGVCDIWLVLVKVLSKQTRRLDCRLCYRVT